MRQRKWMAFTAAATLALLAAMPAAASPSSGRADSSSGTQFTPGQTLLDTTTTPFTTTLAAEPSIKVDSQGHVYVTGPAGVPTGGCPFWRVHPGSLNAQGLPYEYLGKFDTDHGAGGGGDCDIATGGFTPTTPTGFDNLAVSSLTLANLTTNQSSDGGTTFRTPANSAGQQVFGNDRQWNAADQGLGQVYMTVHDVATDNIQFATSTDGGYTYVSNTPAISATPGVSGTALISTTPVITSTPGSCGLVTGCFSAAFMNNHFGNIVVNPRTHKLYTVYIAPANATENAESQSATATSNYEHVIYVAVGDPCAVSCVPGQRILPGTVTWNDYKVYTDTVATDNLAHDFPSIAIDGNGTVYTEWTDTHHVFMSYSTTPDAGGPWSTPVPVDQPSHSTMFPWLVAGKGGAVDLVWYGADLGSGTTCPAGVSGTPDDSNGVNNNCFNLWKVHFAQSLNADTASPTFAETAATGVMHRGSICDQGLTCNTNNGDRTLADFFQVALDPAGAANIAYVDDTATPGTPFISYTRQCTGPSATSSAAINYSCAALTSPGGSGGGTSPTGTPEPGSGILYGTGVVAVLGLTLALRRRRDRRARGRRAA